MHSETSKKRRFLPFPTVLNHKYVDRTIIPKDPNDLFYYAFFDGRENGHVCTKNEVRFLLCLTIRWLTVMEQSSINSIHTEFFPPQAQIYDDFNVLCVATGAPFNNSSAYD